MSRREWTTHRPPGIHPAPPTLQDPEGLNLGCPELLITLIKAAAIFGYLGMVDTGPYPVPCGRILETICDETIFSGITRLLQ